MNQETRDFAKEDAWDGLDMAGRYEAMLTLGREGRLQREVLERLCLRDEEPFVRKRALRMLAARREEGYLDVLHEAMRDPDPMVRIVAAEQLTHCAQEGEDVRLAVSLRPLLYDEDVGVRARAVSLLASSGVKEAPELVLDLFFDAVESGKDRDEINQIASIMCLLKGRKVGRLLKKRLQRLDDEKRAVGAGALRHGGIEIS